MSAATALLDHLRSSNGDLDLITDPSLMTRYLTDATRVAGALPRFVARPRTTQAVSQILRICHAADQPIVVQGGLTGLSGGARPKEGEAVISLENMSCLAPVDPIAATVVVDAGTALQAVQDAADDAGLYFGVDIGARGSATIGGLVSTNAGGIRVLRYDMMRAHVLGVEAVLSDGTILSSLRGLMKDNSGPNLNHLFIGSEGLYGVVTKVCLRLSAKPTSERNALCAVPSITAALALLQRLRSALGPRLTAFEGIFAPVYAGVANMLGSKAPLSAGAPLYILTEVQFFGDEVAESLFETVLMQSYEEGLCEDIVISQSGRDFATIWSVRESCNEYTFSLGKLVGHDVSIPLATLSRFSQEAEFVLATTDPEAKAYVFGHLGDGNLHYVVKTECRERVSPALYELAARCGGSVTAEHGVGHDKREYLSLVRSPAELSTIRSLKMALDPKSILNRNRVIGISA